jgi:peptidoglycan/xylan/chitin deacetylase (PgdA/CDA1 family)
MRMSLLPWLVRQLFQRRNVTILAYHAPTAQRFDAHLTALKRAYNIIALSDYLSSRRTDQRMQLPAKALIITIDDGHRSNHALKSVIEKHGVPVTIFVCSGIIGTQRRFWFLHSPTTAVVQQLKAVTDAERLTTLQSAGFEETTEFADRQALSDAELTDLTGLVDFQSHTVFHPILPRCSAAKAEFEIAGSKGDLEGRFGNRIYALAYPNGSYSERDADLASKAGYRCALTLDRGFNSTTTPLFKLRRICVPDDADRHELLVKASGLWGYISTRPATVRQIASRSVVPALQEAE